VSKESVALLLLCCEGAADRNLEEDEVRGQRLKAVVDFMVRVWYLLRETEEGHTSLGLISNRLAA
jgi:hypothetical protein